jgi:cytochrome c556
MKLFGMSTLAMTVAWAGMVAAGAVTVTSAEDHAQAMKTISRNALAVPKLLEAGAFDEVTRRYVAMREQFVGVEGFWAARPTTDGAILAKNAIAAVDAILKAAGASDRQGIDVGIKQLVAACNACHTKYREPDPTKPNSFVFKKGVL